MRSQKLYDLEKERVIPDYLPYSSYLFLLKYCRADKTGCQRASFASMVSGFGYFQSVVSDESHLNNDDFVLCFSRQHCKYIDVCI